MGAHARPYQKNPVHGRNEPIADPTFTDRTFTDQHSPTGTFTDRSFADRDIYRPGHLPTGDIYRPGHLPTAVLYTL